MICGVGIDIIELNRMEALIERNERFIERILTENEQRKFQRLSANRKVEYIAGRFAAKEAFAKAVGTGIGKVSFKDIEIINNDYGAPNMKVKGYNDNVIHLSISHSKTYAVANVVLETRE
ncbi:holo-ACP synthase [Oceanobacillus iheyensis]|uniref:Holo-[acyl-carrier-protein] synthase n=1 Tax=Oceanobacillus iheyensis (strain DSM 14371 / CIP 107618 / JCM 11309 / KCTC 3954 / HTE831) TaxID=221109 RepID=ACPS_OCEIH|nr:holo-ACP synthase [Oceanobacillus iheyensis]Q8ESK9.1 RecName: Full=Holo-[acyl-carrier-protein] synthase; Short=Holo-ACP synthase; AltName: Full=4'-phosphopantetheinyl transferase AcpS [Oceanobacillus iheyensis HTE831]BAC12575.1 holo-(acyl carrier protein) synthase [Oceanobacillus iheyensis HTE831]